MARAVDHDIDDRLWLSDYSVDDMYHAIVGFDISHGDLCLVDICFSIEQGDECISSLEHGCDLTIGEVTCHNLTIYNMVLQNLCECTFCIVEECSNGFCAKSSKCIIGGS